MAVECPDCKDVSTSITSPYKPYCKLIKAEITQGQFETYCKRFPGYKDCPIRRKHYRY